MNKERRKGSLVLAAVMAVATLLAPTVASAAAGKVTGLVTDMGGNPLGDVLVTIGSEDGSVNETAKTNKRGKFSMTIKEPGKTYSVRMEKSGYDTSEWPIEVRERETVDGQFKLLSAEEGQAHRAELEAIEVKNKASRLYNEGVELYNAGNPEGALQKFIEATVENPDLGLAIAGIGRMHLEAKRYEEAIEPLVRYEEMDPGQMAVLLMLYDAYEGAGMETKAQATLESLIALYPGPQAAARVFGQGVAAATANDLERARERFSLVLEIAPEIHTARINLAHIHKAFGDWDDALSEVDLFLAEEPEHVGALVLRYEALKQLGRDVEAGEALLVLKEASPEEAAAVFHEQGVELFNTNARTAAVFSFRRALEIHPGHPHSHYMLGVCLAGTGELGEAVAFLEKFLELAPDDPDAPAARAMLDSLR